MIQEDPNSKEKKTLYEQLSFCTIRIFCKKADGNTSVGTGFVFTLLGKDGIEYSLLITNRHVIQEAVETLLCFHYKEADGSVNPLNFRQININHAATGNMDFSWTFHPDPNVDLAAFSLYTVHFLCRISGFIPYYITVSETEIPESL